MELMLELRCPVCAGKNKHVMLNNHFNNVEYGQGGKNIYCPECRTLLWITIDGEVAPAMIMIGRRRKNGNGRNEIDCGNYDDIGVETTPPQNSLNLIGLKRK